MRRHCTHTLCAHASMLLLAAALAVAAAEPVYSTYTPQQHPDIDNGIVVWAEETNGYSSVYGVDIFNAPQDLIYVAAYEDSDQDRPAIWYDRVVFQENFEGDWDIYVADISDPANPIDFLITRYEPYYFDDQIKPAIHGNTAVWQSYVITDDGQGGTFEDWDIYAADITEPNNAYIYVVDGLEFDQSAPAVYRSTVVSQDDTNVNTDIYSANVWLKDWPQYDSVIADDNHGQSAPVLWEDIVVYQHEETGGDMNIYARDMSVPGSEPFVIAGGTWNEQAPDISGHIIVWQDNRNGNWDIYGYNLITKKEFRITTDTANQTEPAVSGTTVVWTDARELPTYPLQIYYTHLDLSDAADCPNPLPGDTNDDCRIDLADYATMVQYWLACNLDPLEACPE